MRLNNSLIIIGILVLVILISIFLFFNFYISKSNNSNSIDLNKDTHKFAIYLVDMDGKSEWEKGKENYFQPYKFTQSEWKDFLDKSILGTLLITDKDIDEYDWTTQTIILNKSISEKYKFNSPFHENDYFIVTLNGKRLYGGKIISFMSAMAIEYPVIYIDYKKSNSSIKIRPIHIGDLNYENIDEKYKSNIELSEIKNYFTSKDKLVGN